MFVNARRITCQHYDSSKTAACNKQKAQRQPTIVALNDGPLLRYHQQRYGIDGGFYTALKPQSIE